MSDARALLKAKLAQNRISHPYASYSSTGQLRCTLCATAVKHWEGHLGSKGHRTAVMRAKEEAERRRIAEEEEEARRRAEEEQEQEQEQVGDKRRATDDLDEEDDPRTKRQRTSPPPDTSDSFPTDFFSDPTRELPARDEDEDAEMADASAPAAPAPPTEIDAEWAAFQATVLAPSVAAVQTEDARREAFERATVFAEAELVAPSSFPQLEESVPEPEPEMTEEQRAGVERRRKEQEDRELIMDRLVEEERAQEEADERVSALRNRLERAKRERAARKATKS